MPGSGTYLYNSNKTGTKTVIPRVDIAPHGVETPTQGAPLLIGVHVASEPHPINGCEEFSKFINCHQIFFSHLFLIIME